MNQIDYKALIQDRRAKDRRPIVRHVICLDPELYAELEEAQQELQDELLAEERDDGPKPDRRGGGLPPSAAARERVKEVQSRIADVSIVGVFKAPTSTKQAELNDEIEKARESDPDSFNLAIERHARGVIVLTFQHFETLKDPETKKAKRIDSLDASDLEAMLDSWSHAELVGLGNRIVRAGTEAHEAPKFGRSSQNSQPSDAT